MQLTVFHYHFARGGVTGVVAEAASILLAHNVVEKILLVSGTEENMAELAEGIARNGEVPRDRVGTAVHPELRYAADIAGFRVGELVPQIRDLLESRYLAGDSVWWVHNHHIGKNPAFTQALIETLRHHPQQRSILEIHDFPEAGRYENLRFLGDNISLDPYPLLPRLHYAVINRRDHDILATAGIPEASISLLQNPVRSMPTPRPAARPPTGLGERLARRYRGVKADGAVLLYPVRCIRRKNVLEAAVLARLMEARTGRAMNLLLTLPGLSEQERRYSQMVEDAYSRGVIPGAFGLGAELDAVGLSFHELMQQADLVVSTSVQEGFGYAFFEGLASGTPLLARYLDVLRGSEDLFSSFHTHFYRELQVPFTTPSLSDTRAYLRSRYDEQLDTVREGLPAAAMEELEEAVERLLSGESIDFSFLMPQMQYTLLGDLSDRGFLDHVLSMNRELAERATALLGNRNAGADAAVQERFGPERFRESFRTALRQLETPANEEPAAGTAGAGSAAVGERVLREFATLDYLRLLYSGI